MKKHLLLITLYLTTTFSFAQVVNEQVNFDNPSDQSDHFYGMQQLGQVSSSGVTGGCLTPSSAPPNWGNDNSRYCSKFEGHDTVECQSRMMLYYSDSAVVPGSFDRAVSIWMQPHTDPNHYVIGSLTHDKKLELLTYFSAKSSFPLSLTNNIWYELILSATPHGDSVIMNLQLNDMGQSGTFPPIPVGNINDAIDDSVFTRDNAIELSIAGYTVGGCLRIDNFSFQGIKSADSCLTTGINPTTIDDFKLIVERDYLLLKGENLLNEEFVIYDLMGKKAKTGKLNSGESIDISGLTSGTYLMRLNNSKKSFKLVIE